MLGLLAILVYIFFALSTAALVWAVGQILQSSEWKPGTNPHAWRF
jgi:hypothetical protein